MEPEIFAAYLQRLAKNAQSDASERTHYSALEGFIEQAGKSLGHECDALIELKNQLRGIPDFVVNDEKGRLIGHIEAKDIGENLERIESSAQLKGYLGEQGYDNLILTNYTEWRLYKQGKIVKTIEIAEPQQLRVGLAHGFRTSELESLLRDFFSVRTAHIRSPKVLAEKLAEKAKILRDQVVAFELKEEEHSPLNDVYHVFKQYLLPDLEVDKFADIYAQTITYGLFVARLHSDSEDFNRATAEEHVPRSMPLLRSVFGYLQGAQTPPAVLRLIDEIVDLLAATKVPELKSGLQRKKRSDDPIVYFYEDFLDKYNKAEKEQLGQWYTPIQVVGYMVRSVQHILQKDFGFADGFANEKVHVLDPATGTGTFPAEVIRYTLEYLQEIGQSGSKGAVLDDLLTRVSAFEIQMASYIVAHIKLDVLLSELNIKTHNFPRIYLTNTLDNQPIQTGLGPIVSDLAEESGHALEVKNKEKLLVIIGNPPYSGESANKDVKSINKLMHGIDITKADDKTHDYFDFADGKKEKNPKWVNDDYVKFFRFAQWKIEQSGEGIVAFITNHRWLENPTFRAMRAALLDTFDEVYIYDLHGSYQSDNAADGSIFGIKQGVAISILVKKNHSSKKQVHHADLYGTKEQKLAELEASDITDTKWVSLAPAAPDFYLNPYTEDIGYDKWWAIDDIFRENNVGTLTARDKFAIDFNREKLAERLRMFADEIISPEALGLKDTRDFSIQKAKNVLRRVDIPSTVQPIAYRPFDNRWVCYDDAVASRPRRRLMGHIISHPNNVALSTVRQLSTSDEFAHALASDKITESCYVSNKTKEIGYVFPLWLHDDHSDTMGANSNIKPEFIKEFAVHASSATPATIFAYIYAILYAPGYRQKYADQLRRKFPRIPWPKSDAQFKKLAEIGQQLIDLHLQKITLSTRVTFEGSGSGLVADKIIYQNQKVIINPENWFTGVSNEIWNYQIGGYKVLQQWLKYRKGKFLSLADTTHFCQTAAILKQTTKLQAEIDKLSLVN